MEFYKGSVCDSEDSYEFLKDIGYGTRNPVVGDFIRRLFEKSMVHPFRDDREYAGQVVPLEDSKSILEIASPIFRVLCYCRKVTRGESHKVCLNFGVIGDILGDFPDLIPGGIETLTTEEAMVFLEDCHKRGYVQTVWGYPIPYVGAICNCEHPDCLVGIGARRNYGINLLLKSHYVAEIDYQRCNGCGQCVMWCQFGAITYSPAERRPRIDLTKCFGCGLCKSHCRLNAMNLKSRELSTVLKEEW